MSIIDDLELSVRASNVLKKMGVETMDDFMALTRQTVMRQKNAGRRTWSEVIEVQTDIRDAQRRREAVDRKDTLAIDGYAYPGTRFTREGYISGQGMGMTFRDAAALAALPAIIEQFAITADVLGPSYEKVCAEFAYRFADAMCAARTKVEGETE